MSSISFLGSYSGIDQSMVDELMEAEKYPLIQMTEKKTEYESEQNAWKDINTRLDSLMTTIKDLKYTTTFMAKTATSTDDSTVTASITGSALDGAYQIQVDQLATSTRVIGTSILAVDQDNSTELNLTGSFTLTNADGDSGEVLIEATDSLSSIVVKINDEGKALGLEATIIDGRIVLSDKVTGNRTITLSDSDGTTLDNLGIGSDKVTSAGVNSEFYVNGIYVTRTTNLIDDAVEGLTLSLKNETIAGEYETIVVGSDTSKAVDKMQAFVDQYNSTLSFLKDINDVGDLEATVSGAGALAGNLTVSRIITNLRTLVSAGLGGLDSSISDISQLGISTFDKTGQLEFDSSVLVSALEEDSQNVMNFFLSSDTEVVGFETKMETYVNSLISSSTGIVEVMDKGLGKSLDDIEEQIEKFNTRMETRELYYINMFTKLDVALQQAEAQTSWLSSQLSSLAGTSE